MYKFDYDCGYGSNDARSLRRFLDKYARKKALKHENKDFFSFQFQMVVPAISMAIIIPLGIWYQGYRFGEPCSALLMVAAVGYTWGLLLAISIILFFRDLYLKGLVYDDLSLLKLSRDVENLSKMNFEDRRKWIEKCRLSCRYTLPHLCPTPSTDDDNKCLEYWYDYPNALERVLAVLDDLNLALKSEFENNFEVAVKCYGNVLLKIREGKVGDDDFAYVNLHEENNKTVVTTELIRQRAVAIGWKGPSE